MTKDLVEYIFKGFIAIVLSLSIYIFNGFESSIEQVQHSVTSLNLNLALFAERLMTQKENYLQIEERVGRIEDNMNSTLTTRWTKADHKEYARELKTKIDVLNREINSLKK
jgi:hypothetical protein